MKKLIRRLLKYVWPIWSETYQLPMSQIPHPRWCPWVILRRDTLTMLTEVGIAKTKLCGELVEELRITRQERDTARRQFHETRVVNHHNAAAHRASEVAALRSNNAQNAEIERLRSLMPANRGTRYVEDRTMPAMHVPAPLPVQEPAQIKSP